MHAVVVSKPFEVGLCFAAFTNIIVFSQDSFL